MDRYLPTRDVIPRLVVLVRGRGDVDEPVASHGRAMFPNAMTRSSDVGGDGLTVTHRLCVLQHQPNIIMHIIDVSTISGDPLSEIIRVEHEMRGSGDDAALEFAGVLASSNGSQIYISQATGSKVVCMAGFSLSSELTLLDQRKASVVT